MSFIPKSCGCCNEGVFKTVSSGDRPTELRQSFLKKLSQSSSVKTFDFEQAIQQTKQRLDDCNLTSERARLDRRIHNLTVISDYLLKNAHVKLVGIFGWGKHASGAEPYSGVSEYDTFFLSINGKLIAYQLDSSIQAQDWGIMPTVSSDAITRHTLKYNVTPNGMLPQKFMCGLSRYKIETPVNPEVSDHKDAPTSLSLPVEISAVEGAQNFDGLEISSGFNIAILEKHEVCECCQVVDLDEATALPKVVAGQEHHSHWHSVPEFHSDFFWGVGAGLIVPFAGLGLVGCIRNIPSSWESYTKIQETLQSISENINPEQSNSQEYLGLMAYKKTLEYSRFDSLFNLTVPGILNGSVCLGMLSTLAYHHPFALPLLSLYGFSQFVRNGYDLYRSYKMPILYPSCFASSLTVKKLEGILKVNEITVSRRSRHMKNTAGFLALSAGAAITFVSIPGLFFFGAGAVTLPIGIALLISGAGSTSISNNIGASRFRPRSAKLSVDRTQLTSGECLEEIGKRKQLLDILKKSKKNIITKNRLKRFGYRLLGVLPARSKRSADLIHKNNLKLFEKNSVRFEQKREVLMQKIQSKVLEEPSSQYTFESYWEMCKGLGIQQAVISVATENFGLELDNIEISKCSDEGCEETHVKGFSADHENGAVFTPAQKSILEKACDFYLHFKCIRDNRYELYSLNDFYRALESPKQ